eukprot:m.84239 g.84239  ORF g.84239 m.84239 type:complete len:282 (+) comp9587_c1_seq2:99-944(+)
MLCGQTTRRRLPAAALMRVVLLGATISVTSANDFDFGGPGETCKNAACPSGKTPVPKRPLRLVSRGCSAMGGLTMMGGASSGQDEVTPCCNLRQACFQTCGMVKAKCEDTFEKCTAALCAQNHPGDADGEASCGKTAKLYVTMSKLGGCREWDTAQSAACQCVDDDRGLRRRRQTLEDIYKKVNKAKVDDVPDLAKKHGKSPTKFAKLLMKLIRKYPKLITVQRSKEQDMMDAIRRGDFNPDAFKMPDPTAKDDAPQDKAKTETVENEADAEEEVVVHDET